MEGDLVVQLDQRRSFYSPLQSYLGEGTPHWIISRTSRFCVGLGKKEI